MEEYSRPAALDDLKTLLRSLNHHHVDYFLIGGYALAAHGYQRATTDIDIVVPASAMVGQRVKEALLILPDQAAKEIEPAWFEEGENIRVADAFVVDVMLNANGQTYVSKGYTHWIAGMIEKSPCDQCSHRSLAASTPRWPGP
jgi:hypothetical protein